MAGPIIFFEFLNFFFYSNVHKSLDPTIFCLFLDRLQRLLLAGQDGDGGGGHGVAFGAGPRRHGDVPHTA
ncbi:hypothetical protein HanHA89_Chr14g0540411 [Helianthus annuus]|nr:hypothetical protein HanHA89_Chr14g0540411 [Helianthus annuus]